MAIINRLRPYLRMRSLIGTEMLAECIGTFLLVVSIHILLMRCYKTYKTYFGFINMKALILQSANFS